MSQVMIQPENFDAQSFILVVDDDDTLIKFFKIHLNKFFSKVIAVKSAKEALDVLKEKQIDLVITDISMPKMSGLQLLKRIRKHSIILPVLLISGALFNKTEENEIRKISDGYLKKPFSIEKLRAFIEHGIKLRNDMIEFSETLTEKQKKHFREFIEGDLMLENEITIPSKLAISKTKFEILKLKIDQMRAEFN